MNTINEINNMLDGIHTRLGEMAEQFSNLEDRVMETNQAE